MNFDRIKHIYVCSNGPHFMLGYWGRRWGFGFVLRRDTVRLLCGKYHVIIRVGRSAS